MPNLTFAGVSADGRRLLLVDDQGDELALEITPALRAAVRGESPRTAALETQMTSTLRPREIQDRIRSGETPEAVAEAGRTTVEAIMPFVAPVLAEREHVASRAQKASVRRPPSDGGSDPMVRALGDAVATHLRSQGTKPETVTWDAFRRDDGRWELTARFTTPGRSGTARFAFDAPGSYVTAENDDARWLVGDVVAPAAPARDDLRQVRQRRLQSIPPDELPLGDDVLDLVDEPLTYDEPVRDTTEPAPEPAPELPVEGEPQESAEQAQARHRRAVAKKRGRASVPSWDEIMFGGGADRS